ncbi:CoA-binding protein [Candidatus Woesearchaeota archaeon]|nr:MAG: CoA-binding protein [Candidatus Woesearchaeota archaeon]
MRLDPFFKARRIAVIGASRERGKVGSVILKQLKNKKAYPVNPHAKRILGLKAYASVKEIPHKIDLAIIATRAQTVPKILQECQEKNITHAIIVSAGFKEIGNELLQKELSEAIRKTNITVLGPNCLGVFDAHNRLDTLFLPEDRLKRPKPGGISFLSQSGALGSAVLDLAAYKGYGFAKFISYGNAENVTASDILEFLAKDKDTKVICAYIEGIKDGKAFLKSAKKCKKPIIALKGGITKAGSSAAQSHTGALAGKKEIYYGAFKQAGIIIAHNLEEVFIFASIFSTIKTKPRGKRVQIITNGGGYGIVTADAIENRGLALAKPGSAIKSLKKEMPEGVVAKNPFDLLGDATNERYDKAIKAAMKDKNNDAIVVVILPQTPRIDLSIKKTIIRASRKKEKPIVAVITGSEYSMSLRRALEKEKIPCFEYPEKAILALSAYLRS